MFQKEMKFLLCKRTIILVNSKMRVRWRKLKRGSSLVWRVSFRNSLIK